MIFLYETKTAGIISVSAEIENGELQVRTQVTLGKREQKDVIAVARIVLAQEGQYEDGMTDLRRYK